MINQKYVETECDKSILKNENHLLFSKYFGENAFEKLIELLNVKAKSQKVLFVVPKLEYEKFSNCNNKNFEFEQVVLSVEDFDIKTLNILANELDDAIHFVVGVGCDKEIVSARAIAGFKNLQTMAYIDRVCSLNSFLDYAYMPCGKVLKCENIPVLDYLFIDSVELLKGLNRNVLVDLVFNILSKFGILFEVYVNCCLNKDNGFNKFENNIMEIFNKLDAILNNAIDLSNEDVLTLMDINLEMADLLNKSSYNEFDKESIFASIYIYLNENGGLSFNGIKALGMQVFMKLYQDFIYNLQSVCNTCYNIESRVNYFDKVLKFADLQFNLGGIVAENKIYLLKRFQVRMLSKVKELNNFIQKLMYKTLDLFSDSGYKFTNSIDKDNVFKSVYFTADVVNENTLLSLMRNLGMLDFYAY